jgi:hypothetical protein
MPSFAQNMKLAILTDLQDLVNSGVLASFTAIDYSKMAVLDMNFPSFPSAVVLPPTIATSEAEDSASNLREYIWTIIVVTQPERLSGPNSTSLEALLDGVLNEFDLDITLRGTAIGSVRPAVLEAPGPIANNSITYVVFSVVLKAKQLVPAGVNAVPFITNAAAFDQSGFA